ncbi:MAG: hypothetical protein AXA67_01185 [Methylothermaceae bacteria B42]|nr:MAG: hypothetical protein AXA67_01185 [Methylothermaceae bacteria B42]HHJ40492.1 1-phosphofructokinase family hexose kinase [Methylothermaceae bacterium]
MTPISLPPITTLTLNPAVDVTYEIDHLVKNQKVHSKTSRFDPGGNGINIGRALKRLQVPAKNFCILAGETGQFLERLLARHVEDFVYVRVAGETRINGTIIELDSQSQYEVSGIGPPLVSDDLQRLSQQFVETTADGYGVVTGSIPQGVPEDIYALLIHQIRAAGGRPILDAHRGLLRKGIEAKPFLVKPNRYELEQLTGKSLENIETVVAEARRLHAEGIDYVCVSLGREGAVLVGDDIALHALPPSVPVRSSVGAGDSMVAGLVAGFAQGLPVEETLRLAVACSAGTVKHPGTELFFAEELAALKSEIHIRTLDILFE